MKKSEALEAIWFEAGGKGKPADPEEVLEQVKRFTRAYAGFKLSAQDWDVLRQVVAEETPDGEEIQVFVPPIMDDLMLWNRLSLLDAKHKYGRVYKFKYEDRDRLLACVRHDVRAYWRNEQIWEQFEPNQLWSSRIITIGEDV